MLGPSLLVCPVTSPIQDLQTGSAAHTRTVYLPAGCCWYDFRDNRRYEGGQCIQVPAGIDSIPIFVREGAILPTAQPQDSSTRMEGQDIHLLVYAGRNASYTFYEDAGDSYGYEKDEKIYARRRLHGIH